ncbi:hypothetical protein [Rhizobium sullae]|uniref:Uncharacterized protein n=1 Tax=Rhizobium sullae TaxID=50338 RepID=A0A4R3QBA9_RHISU|nr:hypothetical protein [Rhizobium sullae]TCU18803.1 hypothetical protein EV132_10230 [Rhizobium sullae]
MNDDTKLTASQACRVVGMDPNRLNEDIAAGRFPCAPSTIPGRARLFDRDDMLALWLYRERLERERNAKNAGHFACSITELARRNPEAIAISIVNGPGGNRSVSLADDLPSPSEWDKVIFSGTPIHDVTTYNIHLIRKFISERVQDELKTDD